MAFEVKEWMDRQVQYPGRRKLIQTIIENVYDIERAEGTVSEPGNAFDAANMNDLEARIKAAFESIRDTDISVMDKNNHFTAEKLDGVLDELFMFASNGKKEFANAIGGSASSTFESLANLASAIKQDRDNGKSLIANAIGGNASPSNSFEQLANLVKKKKNFWIGNCPVFNIQTRYATTSYRNISINFGFIPSYIFLGTLHFIDTYNDKNGTTHQDTGKCYITSIDRTFNGYTESAIYNISSSGFTIWHKPSSVYSEFLSSLSSYSSTKIYAFE